MDVSDPLWVRTRDVWRRVVPRGPQSRLREGSSAGMAGGGHLAPLSMGILQARILEWVVMPSSRGSSQPRDQTQVFPIAGGFFTV